MLRYLSQVYKTLTQTVPDDLKTADVWDTIGFFRALLTRVDTSLIEEWEGLLDREHGTDRRAGTGRDEQALGAYELTQNPSAFAARVRAEIYQLVAALAKQDWEEAENCLSAHDQTSTAVRWDAARFEQALAPFLADYEELVFTPAARQARLTRISQSGQRTWEFTHTLLDPEGDDLWCLEGFVDLTWLDAGGDQQQLQDPLIRLRTIGP